jgi:polar amino acid transport system substrate-binding protein
LGLFPATAALLIYMQNSRVLKKGGRVMMKRRLVVLLGTLVYVSLVSVHGFAADKSVSVSPVIDRILTKKELVVGTAASMPPLNMTTKDGQIAGMEVDIAKIFATSMEVKLTLKPMRFDELLTAVESGKVDMVLSGVTMTPLRNLRVAFAGPYFDSGKSILAKKANTSGMATIAEMNDPGKTFVALKGSTSQRFVEKLIPKAKLILVEDYAQAVAMVRDDKASAMVADFPICLVSVYRYPEAGLATLDNPVSYEPIGVALPSNDPLLLNWVQNTINTLKKSGEMERLLQQWFKETDWVKQLP